MIQFDIHTLSFHFYAYWRYRVFICVFLQKKIIAYRTVFSITLRLCSKFSQYFNFFIEDIIWYFKVLEDWWVKSVYCKHGSYTKIGSFFFFLQNFPPNYFLCIILPILKTSCGKVKTIPIQAWTGPSGSRRLILPEFVDNQQATVAMLSALRAGHLYPNIKLLIWTNIKDTSSHISHPVHYCTKLSPCKNIVFRHAFFSFCDNTSKYIASNFGINNEANILHAFKAQHCSLSTSFRICKALFIVDSQLQ